MRFYTRSRRKPAIIIVSLIDILAILLIFFIVTTTFKKNQPQVKINLPESATAVEVSTDERPILVAVDAEGEVFVEDAPVTAGQLSREIAQRIENEPGRGFAMRADEGAPFGVVVKVMDAFKQNGIRNLPTFTERPSAAAGGGESVQ